GYRVIWVHSSPKAARDAAARAARIEAGLAAIDALQVRLSSPKTRLKTLVAAETAATTALDQAGATRWITYTITAAVRADTVAYNAVTDGCFPLITNDTTMTPAQVLAAYRLPASPFPRKVRLVGVEGVLDSPAFPRSRPVLRSGGAVQGRAAIAERRPRQGSPLTAPPGSGCLGRRGESRLVR
ncbi:MAG TPA: hypothetical protein VF320_10545, partial [Acidimicrobiales bacterium]